LRILGFDPGLRITGFGILEKEGRQIKSVCFGLIKPPANKPLPERLKFLYHEAIKIIDTYKPEVVAIEDTFYQKNVKSAIMLGQARGTLLLAGANRNLVCREYAPRKVKMSVTGNGAASKEQVKYMVMQILSLKEIPTTMDASDALAVGLCFLNQELGL